MVDHAAIVIIAKRGSGKSWVTREILYQKRHIPCGIVISPSDQMNGEYKGFFPDIYIHYDISSIIFGKILYRQQEMLTKQKMKEEKGLKIDPSSILIMDDCLAERSKWSKIDEIRIIMMNGRHFKLTYILTMQEPIGLPPNLRLNFDYIFLLRETSAINRKKLWLNYASMFDNLPLFEKVFSSVTENFCCMVIDNRNQSDSLDKQVYWFRAQERKFEFGSDKFWALHERYYDEKYMQHCHNALKEKVKGVGTRKKNDLDIKIVKL